MEHKYNYEYKYKISWVGQSTTTYKDLLLFDIKERPQRFVTFETYNQSDHGRWPDKKDNDKDNEKDKDNDKDKYI